MVGKLVWGSEAELEAGGERVKTSWTAGASSSAPYCTRHNALQRCMAAAPLLPSKLHGFIVFVVVDNCNLAGKRILGNVAPT